MAASELESGVCGETWDEVFTPGGTRRHGAKEAAAQSGCSITFMNELPLPPPFAGNAYACGAERFPPTLRQAVRELERGSAARTAFGDAVVDHYLNTPGPSSACPTWR